MRRWPPVCRSVARIIGWRGIGRAARSPARYRDPAPSARDGEIERLRRQRMPGNRIARLLGLPRSTVGAELRRLGLGRLKALDPPAPVVRYERERPGELLHLDTKKLGRIAGVGHRITGQHSGMVKNRGIGWEALHVCVDDASRLAYTELLPDEPKKSAIAFLDRALAWFDRLGVGVERVMTDNGSAYRSHALRPVLPIKKPVQAVPRMGSTSDIPDGIKTPPSLTPRMSEPAPEPAMPVGRCYALRRRAARCLSHSSRASRSSG